VDLSQLDGAGRYSIEYSAHSAESDRRLWEFFIVVDTNLARACVLQTNISYLGSDPAHNNILHKQMTKFQRPPIPDSHMQNIQIFAPPKPRVKKLFPVLETVSEGAAPPLEKPVDELRIREQVKNDVSHYVLKK